MSKTFNKFKQAFILTLLFTNSASSLIFAKNQYLIKQNAKLFGPEILQISPTEFNLMNPKQNIQIYCNAKDYKVYYINYYKKQYFVTTIDKIQDPQGSGILKLIIINSPSSKILSNWLKIGKTHKKDFDCIEYKYKDGALKKTSTFYKMLTSDLPDINKKFVELHARINGLPITSQILLELTFINESCRIDELIITNSVQKLDSKIAKPSIDGYKLVKSEAELRGLGNNKAIINEFFNF